MKRISQVAVLLLCASPAFGQTVLATVTGTITDPAGAVVPNAPVSLKNVETGQIYTAASSDTGNYTVGVRHERGIMGVFFFLWPGT